MCIRKAIAARGQESCFKVSETRMSAYKSCKSAIGRLLSRCHLVMSDTLQDVVEASLKQYAAYILHHTRFAVAVHSSSSVRTHLCILSSSPYI
jgi:hypothetical protein